jgi:hypothetical protein
VYRGQLCAGTRPLAKVSRYLGGEKWQEFGRVGDDGTEVNALVVYNVGKESRAPTEHVVVVSQSRNCL